MKLNIWKTLTIFSLLHCLPEGSIAGVVRRHVQEATGQKFYYFGFGSNMLSKRIHIQNPTAKRVGGGLLRDFRLDFNTHTGRWRGAPATIVPTANATVYGTVWQIDMSNLPDIDDQEGVAEGIYEPLILPVQLLSNGTELMARAYKLVKQPRTEFSSYAHKDVPSDRQPSKTYLQCLVAGAEETTDIPQWYINWLKSLRHNGQVASDMEDTLELEDVELLS